MFDNSEEYDFTPSSSSKLASLFGLNSGPNEETSDSLIYKPPKQPVSQDSKKNTDINDSSKSKMNTTVIIANVVNLWKLEAKNYKLLGTYGLALIGSTDLNLFEVIGYKEKNNIIFRAKVNDSFIFYNQKDNFSTFCDDAMQQWLVKFTNNNQAEFSKNLESHGAKVNHVIDKTEEKHSLRNEASNFTPDSTEVSTPKPDILPKPELNMEMQSDSSSGSQKRANILTRMAKMGQPILPTLPLKNITSSDLSDSEKEEKNDKRIPPRKFKRVNQEKPPKEELLNQVVDNRQLGQMLPIQSNPMTSPFNLSTPVILGQPLGYDGLNIILTQNTELKLNIAQLSAKLDSVLNVGDVGNSKNNSGQLIAKNKALELKLDNLQTALEKLDRKYFNLKEKYDSLLKKTEDKSEIESQEKKIKKLDEEITKLKMDLEERDEKLKNKEMVENDLENYKIQITELQKIIENQAGTLKDFEQLDKTTEELEATIESLNSTISSLNFKIENYKLKQKDFEDYFRQDALGRKDKMKKIQGNLNNYNELVKRDMNEMYQSILDDFDDDIACTYTYSDIQAIVAKRLKGTTFKLIEDCRSIFLESSELLND